jgi:TonB family protein
MIPATAGNFLASSAQIALIATIASVALWALRLRAPGVRYTYWRIVAVLCLSLPWMQPHVTARAGSVTVVESIATAGSPASATPLSLHADLVLMAVLVLAAGALLRLAWLGVGLVRLRQLRRRAAFGPRFAGADDLQHTLGVAADVRFAAGLAHPVTFGLFKPVVLLPESLQGQSPEIQRAVVGHELIHVRRRDWAWLIAEEVAVCFAWFHPAAWWIASRIQLTREEVVDELAVLLTGRRKAYVEALLAFSDSISVVPTAAFAKRRHLFRRIALVSREDLMSSRRIVASCAVMALALPLGTWSAVSAFPLHTNGVQAAQLAAGPGPLERRAHTVTPENPVPRRIHYEAPTVPDVAKTASAKIAVKVTLDNAGNVAEARTTAIAVKGPAFNIEVAGDDMASKLDGKASLWSSDPNVAAAARETVMALVDSALTSVRGWRYDPPADAPLTFSISIRYGDKPETMAFSPKEDGVLRVGGVIKAPVKIVDVRPVYPEDARAAGVAGVVIIDARIGAEGTVEAARVIKSIPLLDQAALDAVKQWKFVPTLMNGVPTPISMTVAINFNPE